MRINSDNLNCCWEQACCHGVKTCFKLFCMHNLYYIVRATHSVINSLLTDTVVVKWLQRVHFNLCHVQDRSGSLIIAVMVLVSK
jgi:hypothetical protein